MEPHNPQDHDIITLDNEDHDITTLDTPIPNLNLVPDIPLDIAHPSIRLSSRVKHQPSHLKDYVCASFNDSPNQSSSGTIYPISNFLSYSYLSPSYCRFILSFTT